MFASMKQNPDRIDNMTLRTIIIVNTVIRRIAVPAEPLMMSAAYTPLMPTV